MASLIRGLVAAVLVGMLAICLGGCSTAAVNSALKIGDCVNDTDTTDANGDPTQGMVVTSCAQTHDEEVFSVFDFPNPPTAFPGYEAIGAIQQTQCENDFTSYVGVSWEQSATYSIDYAGPTEQTWASGDRVIVCLLDAADGTKLTGSAKDTAR